MAKYKLNDRLCAAEKCPAGAVQIDLFDILERGLALRVFRSGAKSWMYRFSWGGKRKWMLLGSYPATPLAKARTKAHEARTALEADPPQDPRIALAPAPADTLRGVCDEWAQREAAGLRTGKDRVAVLNRAVAVLGADRAIAEVRRSDVVRMLDRIQDDHGPVAADRALGVLRRVLNWYASRSDDYRSPIVRGMARTKTSERARARILTDDELRLVWRTAEGAGVFGRLLKFLLLTGARRTEAAAMPWSELDGADWTLPASRNKTRLDLLRPLSPQALAVLGNPAGPFAFPASRGRGWMRDFSDLKETFDRATGPMERWTLHDLRRTARSLLSRAGVAPDHAERCLGHVIGGVRAVYDRHEYRDEKAKAYEALARLIDRIVTGKPTVVTLRRREAQADAQA
jgi:integrase